MSRVSGRRRAGFAAAVWVALLLPGAAALAGDGEFRFPESDEVMDGPGLFSGEAGAFTVNRWPGGEITFSDKPPTSGGSYTPPRQPARNGAGSGSGAQGGYRPPASYQGGALSYPGQPAPVFQQPYRQPYPQARRQPVYPPPAYGQPYPQPAYRQQAQQPPAYGQPVYQPPAYQQPYRPPAYAGPTPQQPQAQGGGGASPATGE